MPPARKNVYYVDAEAGAKRPLPRHIIDIQSLLTPENINKKMPHLVLNIDEHSPEEISIKRNGNTLTVETKTGDKKRKNEGGAEHVVRSYEIPEEGYTKEFEDQIAVDNILKVGHHDHAHASNNVYTLCNEKLPLKGHGKKIALKSLADWNKQKPMKFVSVMSKNFEVKIPNNMLNKEKEAGNDAENIEVEKKTNKDKDEGGNGAKGKDEEGNGVEENGAKDNGVGEKGADGNDAEGNEEKEKVLKKVEIPTEINITEDPEDPGETLEIIIRGVKLDDSESA